MSSDPASSPRWRKLGIIAGAGELPVRVASYCAAIGQPFHVSRIGEHLDPRLEAYGGDTFGIGELGKRFEAFRAAGCDVLVMAGVVPRPDFKSLKVDFKGAQILPKALAAARHGDDALLSLIISECEKAGFKVIGVNDVTAELLAPAGLLAGPALSQETFADIRKAAAIAAAIGDLDIGQGAVVCDGLVLAVEAQEGTDSMLRRVADLPERLRGAEAAPRGALVKRPKPNQERRVDLPTIGIATIENAHRAGLAAIGYEAGASLILDRPGVSAAAQRLGLSLYGFTLDELAGE